MNDYHYNVMKRHYGEKISLMYTDTGELLIHFITYFISTNKLILIDSLVYFIETDDFYENLTNNPILLDRMDTTNVPREHPCYIAERKMSPGLFSDETNGDKKQRDERGNYTNSENGRVSHKTVLYYSAYKPVRDCLS